MITKDNNLKIMELFFKYPYGRFHIREIARLTNLSVTGVIKIINRLKKERLVISAKKANIEEVKPDFEGRFLVMKRIYNLYSLYESGLVAYLKGMFEMPKSIILFGSYSDGTDTEISDIDIAIASNKKDMPDLAKFEKKLARKINLHVLDLGTSTKEFRNSIANGIVLEGFAELIK